MGGASSSLHRQRTQFLIRLYNAGISEKTTLRQIFGSDVHRKYDTFGDERSFTRSEFAQILGEDAATLIYGFNSSAGSSNQTIPLEFIVKFLEAGTISQEVRNYVGNNLKDTTSTIRYNHNYAKHPIYVEVLKSLEFDDTKYMERPNYSKTKNDNSKALVVHRGITDRNDTPFDSIIKKKKVLAPQTTVWKKHETVIQERITKYITVEKDGTTHELIETDKSQNETIHLECKKNEDGCIDNNPPSGTDCFAHREYSQQEQTEMFDNEMSSFVRATEEYIHLKSDVDEYEYLHSDGPS